MRKALLPDGRLLVSGGNSNIRESSMFDWRTNVWSAEPDMKDTRWVGSDGASTRTEDASMAVADCAPRAVFFSDETREVLDKAAAGAQGLDEMDPDVLERALALPNDPDVPALVAVYVQAVEHLRALEAAAVSVDRSLAGLSV